MKLPEAVWDYLDEWAYDKVWKGQVIHLPEEITEAVMEPIFLQVIELMLGDKPVLLVCDSNGGNAHVAFMLADLIHGSEVPIYTLVRWRAASAAVVVMAAGQKRLMYPRARLGTHGPRFVVGKGTYDLGVAEVMDKHFQTNLAKAWKSSRKQMHALHEKYAGRVLPESIFGKEVAWHDVDTSRGLGFADMGHPAPAFHLWWEMKAAEWATWLKGLFTTKERRPG